MALLQKFIVPNSIHIVVCAFLETLVLLRVFFNDNRFNCELELKHKTCEDVQKFLLTCIKQDLKSVSEVLSSK